MDVARLSYEIDSSQTRRASTDLGRMSRAATDAQRSKDGLASSSTRAGRVVASANDNMARSSTRAGRSFSGALVSSNLLRGGLVGLVATIGALSGALIGLGTRAALSLDRALTEAATLTQDAKDNLGQLSDAARGLAREFGGNALEQTQAFYQAISAGAGTVTQATALLRDANRLAVAGVTDVTTGVNILTTAINAYGRESLSTAAASDAIFTGVRAGRTTVNELSSSLGNVIPIASSLGIEFEELVASVASLTTQGQTTSQAVTGVRSILASVAAPASQAAMLANQLGIEFNTAALESRGLAGFLQDVIRATGGSNEQLARLFGSVEALGAVLAFSGGAGERFNEILVDMSNNVGATDDALNTVSESLSNRYDVAWARISDTIIDVGNRVLPLVVGALELIAPAMESAVSSVVNGVDRMQAEFNFIKEVVQTAFTNIPSAIATGILVTMNFVVTTVEQGLNLILGDINNVIAGINRLGGSFSQIELFNTNDNNFEALTQSFGGLSEAGAQGFQQAIDRREATLTEIAGRSQLLSQSEADLITSLLDDTIPSTSGSQRTIAPRTSTVASINAGGGGASGSSRSEQTAQRAAERAQLLSDLRQEVEILGQSRGERESNIIQLEREREIRSEIARLGEGATQAERDAVRELVGERQRLNEENERQVSALQSARDAAGSFFDDLRSGLQQGQSLWQSFGNAALGVLNSITDRLLNQVLDAVFQVGSASSGGGGAGGAGGIFSSIISGVSSLFGGFRAEGGPVNPSQAFIVGERGPELFVPPSSGNIIPNNQMQSSSSGSSVNVQVVNNASGVRHEVQQMGPNEVRIIASEVVRRDAPGVISGQMANANSQVSKSLAQNTNSARRR